MHSGFPEGISNRCALRASLAEEENDDELVN